MPAKRHKPSRPASVPWPERVIQLFFILMLGVFPLYYQNKYYNIGDAKYRFFRTVTLGMLFLLAAVLLFEKTAGPSRKESRRQTGISFPDGAILAYTAAAALSWLFSPFRTKAWIGSHEWYMGLLSQLLFTGIYFSVSRFCTRQKWPLWVMGFSGSAVFLTAYLHRFRIDPLGLYDEISSYHQLLFLGTIGQSTWYSSYISVVLPVMMGIYMTVKKTSGRKEMLAHGLTGVFIFLGFCSAVTQNSDSIYAGLSLSFLFLLWFALEDLHTWKRYLELMITAVSAAKFTGLLQTAFPERVPALDPLSLYITQSAAGWPVLAVFTAAYLLARLTIRRSRLTVLAKSRKPEHFLCLFRTGFFSLTGIGLIFLFVFMWLAASGKVPETSGILSQSGYLVYDGWSWGSGRGRTWNYCIRIFSEYPPLMKLFGCGPDALTFYSDAWYAEEVRAMWGNLSLTNAHNEWLTALINYGITGAAAYLSFFSSSVVRTVKNRKNQPVLLAAGAAVLAYAGHNFFCYQQTVCTPLIFIVTGAAEYLIQHPARQKND